MSISSTIEKNSSLDYRGSQPLSSSTLASPIVESLLPEKTIFRDFGRRSCLPTDNLWQIKQGVVRTLSWHEDGTVITLGLWGAGSVIGGVLSQASPYTIECLTEVTAINCLGQDIKDFPDSILDHIYQLEAFLSIRSFRRVEEMIMRLLEYLADRFGHTSVEGQVIDLRITHQDIADLLGTTRVTVTRALGDLEERGLINRTSIRRIVLKNSEYWHYQI